MSSKFRRVTYTLPPELVDGVAYLSGRVGVSRSSLVAELLREAIPHMVEIVSAVPEQPTDDDVRRFKGRSKDVISERVDNLVRMRDDLFSQ